MPVNIPLFSDTNYTQIVKLDSIDYRVAIRFNAGEEAWYFTIVSPSGDNGFTVKLVEGLNLFMCHSAEPDLPSGELWLITADGRMPPSGFDEGTSGTTLLYFGKDEEKPLDFLS